MTTRETTAYKKRRLLVGGPFVRMMMTMMMCSKARCCSSRLALGRRRRTIHQTTIHQTTTLVRAAAAGAGKRTPRGSKRAVPVPDNEALPFSTTGNGIDGEGRMGVNGFEKNAEERTSSSSSFRAGSFNAKSVRLVQWYPGHIARAETFGAGLRPRGARVWRRALRGGKPPGTARKTRVPRHSR